MTFIIKIEHFYIILVTLYHLQKGCCGYDPEASITGLYTGPYFDPLAPRNLTAHLGDRAVLPCTVRQLGDKSVSWVRMRDADILTVDRYTFVSDERFEAHYAPSQETWNLIIKYVQERDAGQYECQVSTEPKMSQLFNLRVVVPRVSMLPPGDRYVKAGSKVRIDCQITDVVQQPDYIFWYHDGVRVLEQQDSNLAVIVKKTGEESMVSTLTISRVRRDESGNYTCMPSNLHASSVLLHVLNEEHPEAMKDGRNASCKMEQPIYLFLLFALCTALNRLFNDGSLPNEVIDKRKNSAVKKRCQLTRDDGKKTRHSETDVEGKNIEKNKIQLLTEILLKISQNMLKENKPKIDEQQTVKESKSSFENETTIEIKIMNCIDYFTKAPIQVNAKNLFCVSKDLSNKRCVNTFKLVNDNHKNNSAMKTNATDLLTPETSLLLSNSTLSYGSSQANLYSDNDIKTTEANLLISKRHDQLFIPDCNSLPIVDDILDTSSNNVPFNVPFARNGR